MKKFITILCCLILGTQNNSTLSAGPASSVFQQTVNTAGAVAKATLQTIHAHPYIASCLLFSYLAHGRTIENVEDAIFVLSTELALGKVIETSTGFVLQNLEFNNECKKMIYIKDLDLLCQNCKSKINRTVRQ